MSTYKAELPKAFPWVISAKPEEIRQALYLLASPFRKDVPQGSSFAVTVDNWDGTWNLWLSEASFVFLSREWDFKASLAELLKTVKQSQTEQQEE